MNINSTYEFQLFIHDKNNTATIYERNRVTNLNSAIGAIFIYGLIPQFKHTIVFKHIVNSLGYAESTKTITSGNIQFNMYFFDPLFSLI